MTISSLINKNIYTGNGATAEYDYTFKIFKKEDLILTQKDTNDVETVLVLDTDYSVAEVGESVGGSITLLSGNLPVDYVLTIRRKLALKQETQFRNQSEFYAENHEDEFDRSRMIAQQQQDEIERSVKLPETIDQSGFNLALPASIVGSAERAIIVNASGDGLDVGASTTEISNASANATSAAASALAASLSETNAVNAANSIKNPWREISYKTSTDSPISILGTDSGILFELDASSGGATFTLPLISSLDLNNVNVFTIKKTDSTFNPVQASRSGADTINGGTANIAIFDKEVAISFIPSSTNNWTTIKHGNVPENLSVTKVKLAEQARNLNVTTVTSIVSSLETYDPTVSDDLILVDSTAVALDIPLPGSVDIGKRYTVKKIDSSLNEITFSGTGSEVSTTKLLKENDFVEWTWDGLNWRTTNLKLEPIVAIYEVTGGTANPSFASLSVERIDYNSKIIDTHNAFATGVSAEFTVPRAGAYNITASVIMSSTIMDYLFLYFKVNNTNEIYKADFASSSREMHSSLSSSLNALEGDTIKVDCMIKSSDFATKSINSGSNLNRLTITEVR